MKKNTKVALLACSALAVGALTAKAISATNQVKITTSNGQRCIQSNGIPDHSIGQFPNKGNPNFISTQNTKLCVTMTPSKGSQAKDLRGSTGFTLNGVTIRPGTADWYDASSPRGHSRDRSSGWNLDGMGPGNTLGLDQNNAHVDNRGLYHYHGPSKSIMNAAQGTLIGYAADGHGIHYVGSNQTSSWQLKKGTRPSAPGGAYDGTYNQDFEYVAGSGSLDECNGATVNGEYKYFATDTYPYFPRCAFGTVSSDFSGPRGVAGSQQGNQQRNQINRQQGGQRGGGDQSATLENGNERQGKGNFLQRLFGKQQGQNARSRQQGNRRFAQSNNGGRRGPPQQAISACASASIGNSCSFQTPRGNLSGQCVLTPDQQKACRPNR
ncbi:YHYH protein [Lentilitoribacter sp. EG35]|uniref:YHYH protein n=1 Tax=Lentilitoribacter sp. EG35 TaxID=3234192 RepID=UPI00346162BD